MLAGADGHSAGVLQSGGMSVCLQASVWGRRECQGRQVSGRRESACLLGRPLTWGNPHLKLISTKGKLVIMSDIIIILFF